MPRRVKDTPDPAREADLGAQAQPEDLLPGSEEATAEPAQFGSDLEAELELARKQAAEHLELAQRVQAEWENFRKRASKEAQDTRDRAAERVVMALLPVLDNMERAIEHTTAGGDVKQLLSGVEMVHNQMHDVLRREGVEVLDPFGAPFDPVNEQAVGQREDPEVPEGTVVEVYQKGYTMGGKCVRPAMVVVSTGGPRREE